MKMIKNPCMTFLTLAVGATSGWAANEADFAGMLGQLRTELAAKLPVTAKTDQVNAFLSSDALDAKLAKFVVLQ